MRYLLLALLLAGCTDAPDRHRYPSPGEGEEVEPDCGEQYAECGYVDDCYLIPGPPTIWVCPGTGTWRTCPERVGCLMCRVEGVERTCVRYEYCRARGTCV
jgi:hypothetical protein